MSVIGINGWLQNPVCDHEIVRSIISSYEQMDQEYGLGWHFCTDTVFFSGSVQQELVNNVKSMIMDLSAVQFDQGHAEGFFTVNDPGIDHYILWHFDHGQFGETRIPKLLNS